MEQENICKFNVTHKNSNELNVLNFVYENKIYSYSHPVVLSVFRLYLIFEGDGLFLIDNKNVELKKGNLLFTHPDTCLMISSSNNLRFMFISFIGIKAYEIYKRIGVNSTNYIRKCDESLMKYWLRMLKTSDNSNIDLISESVLLYTFSIYTKNNEKHDLKVHDTDAIKKIKKIVDEDFSSPTISLEKICSNLYYNPDYISSKFRKIIGMNFSNYLQILRMNNAVNLINKGESSVKSIASKCGYIDSLYFSKVYKKNFGHSPSRAIKNVKEKKEKLNKL